MYVELMLSNFNFEFIFIFFIAGRNILKYLISQKNNDKYYELCNSLKTYVLCKSTLTILSELSYIIMNYYE